MAPVPPNFIRLNVKHTCHAQLVNEGLWSVRDVRCPIDFQADGHDSIHICKVWWECVKTGEGVCVGGGEGAVHKDAQIGGTVVHTKPNCNACITCSNFSAPDATLVRTISTTDVLCVAENSLGLTLRFGTPTPFHPAPCS